MPSKCKLQPGFVFGMRGSRENPQGEEWFGGRYCANLDKIMAFRRGGAFPGCATEI